jgi:hypothetical protein
MCFAPDKKKHLQDFQNQRYIGICMSLKERERERERGGEHERESKSKKARAREQERERERGRERERERDREKENKSAGYFSSKPPGPKLKIRQILKAAEYVHS